MGKHKIFNWLVQLSVVFAVVSSGAFAIAPAAGSKVLGQRAAVAFGVLTTQSAVNAEAAFLARFGNAAGAAIWLKHKSFQEAYSASSTKLSAGDAIRFQALIAKNNWPLSVVTAAVIDGIEERDLSLQNISSAVELAMDSGLLHGTVELSDADSFNAVLRYEWTEGAQDVVESIGYSNEADAAQQQALLGTIVEEALEGCNRQPNSCPMIESATNAFVTHPNELKASPTAVNFFGEVVRFELDPNRGDAVLRGYESILAKQEVFQGDSAAENCITWGSTLAP